MALTNNDIFKKLRVAHKLRDEDIVKICALNGFEVSKSELGAIFRNPTHEKYKPCGDQLLRNFLDGLIIHMRGEKDAKPMKPRTDRIQKQKELEEKQKNKPKTYFGSKNS